MSEFKNINPDYIFEVSWEVCNKVGGIYTVISTKAKTLVDEHKDNFILIGPDVWRETRENPEFIEDKFLYKSWREQAERDGLRFKIGRWKISGNPVAVLVDFTQYFANKDKIFTEFWIKYKLDSLSGQWDYVEPALFGYASAKIIESFYRYNISGRDKIIAQFHEWMTGTGVLYLKDNVPQAATVFTTHATAIARSIAGNGLPLYKNLTSYNAERLAVEFNIASKQSLEKLSANECDSFTTVSEITAAECKQFLGKEVDVVTPNGFEDSFVPDAAHFEEKRSAARHKLFEVAEGLLQEKLAENTFFVANSGRYEFRNKGIDLFIDSLGKLNKRSDLNTNVVAFILVPANHAGPRKDLLERIPNKNFDHPITDEYLSHYLHDAEWDPTLKRIRENNLRNLPEDKVKIIFVPCYLNGSDGIFDLDYYDLLIGFDLTVFPSYYEPWGYTPLESIAFHIPTVTTTLAGFGMWIRTKFSEEQKCVMVVTRTDDNDNAVSDAIENAYLRCLNKSPEEREISRNSAYEISQHALWTNLVDNYKNAYSFALEKSKQRKDLYITKHITEQAIAKRIESTKPVWNKILIKTDLPEKLKPLRQLMNNIWWSWNHEASELFGMIDPVLWKQVNHNPTGLFDALSYERIAELENDQHFIEKMHQVNAKFQEYINKGCEKPAKQIAYFSMEFGLHDTIKIFSGGLGMLAGDYLKEASDANENIVGIGLLYRYGYFNQKLSNTGEQLESYTPQKFSALPIHAVRNSDKNWVKVSVAFPGRTVYAKVWRVDVGRVPLYLLDTDIEDNSDTDRFITHQLYGGDWENRLKQELLLGVGGIRMLDALGLKPDIFHCNEGHAACMGLERLRKYVQDEKFNFYEAIEIVRSSTLFTTHTPVPAGHDAFSEDLLRTYIPHYPSRLNISWETFINLGKFVENDPNEKFSMSVLAAKLSQEMNGVSRIHGRVSREMFKKLWDAYYPNELYIGHVTNGVHYPTWASKRWKLLYERTFGEGFQEDQTNPDYWKKIHHVPDQEIWDIRQAQRKELIDCVKERLMENLTHRQENPKLIFKTIESFDEKALTIGFARRFATYKRAHLLFKNIERLAAIVNNQNKPVQFIFAGKAHPQDEAGQDLIKQIVEISKRPEFIGKITFLEGYDIELAKILVRGVDIWLNTPTRPLEASGTSGEKAVMNGVVNFSVLDGWWAEGYKPGAGWALKEEQTYENHQFQDALDAETIYNIFEDEIIPMFYDRNEQSLPVKWISQVKNTISEIAPHFTMRRQLNDYQNQYYKKLIERTDRMKENDYDLAKQVSNWKKRMMRGWESIEVVSMSIPDSTHRPLHLGEKFIAEIILDLHELSSDDIGIEVMFGHKVMDEVKELDSVYEMQPHRAENGTVIYRTEIKVTQPGVFDYSFRIFPKSDMLAHRQDFNLVKWL